MSSPAYTARASTRGMTAKRRRTSIAGYGVTGGIAGAGAGRRACTRRPPLTRRMNCTTSSFRGEKTTTKSSSWSFPTSITRVFERSQRYWLWSTIAWRIRAALRGLEGRQEQGGALAGDVAPAHRPLVVHRQRIAVHPEEVQREVAEQVVAPVVGARVDSGDDVGLGRGLLLEVTLDHGG